MDRSQKECDQVGGQNICKETCLSIAYPTQKPATSIVIMDKSSETNFASQTPEKDPRSQPLHLHAKFSAAQFESLQSQSCKTITEVFDAMLSSLRLLSLGKKLPTFQNICNQVQVLVKREISYGQLAQTKYILPEAIHIDKILVHDKKTLCMKQDIVIILLFDVTEGHHKQSDYIALRQIFSDRLSNYFNEHPEVHVIPEAILPDLFDKSKQTAVEDQAGDFQDKGFPKTVSQLCETTDREQVLPISSIECPPDTLSNSTHLYPPFCRMFSRKDFNAKKDKTEPVPSPFSLSQKASYYLNNQDGKTVIEREFCSLSSQLVTEASKQAKESSGTYSNSTFIESTSVRLIRPHSSANSNSCGSRLSNLASAADSLTIETPAQSTPKRAVPSSDEKLISTPSQRQTLSFKSAKRYLDFSCLKSNEHVWDFVVDESDHCNRQKGHISQALCGFSSPLQKVEESHGCTTKLGTSDCLSDLVSLIHSIFQSINYCPITKEELVYRIIINGLDLAKRREVEEQIEILEKLVPDWIFQKLAHSGDTLYSIKKMSILDSVRARVTSR